MFRTVPLSIIRSFSLHIQQWYMSYRFADSLRAVMVYNFCITFNLCYFTSEITYIFNSQYISITWTRDFVLYTALLIIQGEHKVVPRLQRRKLLYVEYKLFF